MIYIKIRNVKREKTITLITHPLNFSPYVDVVSTNNKLRVPQYLGILSNRKEISQIWRGFITKNERVSAFAIDRTP